MPDHTGRRRRRPDLQSILQTDLPIGRFVVLLVAIVAIIRLLTLPEPQHGAAGDSAPSPAPTVAPAWSGPAPVDSPGRLADGAMFTPRLYLTPQISVGLSQAASFWRVLVRTGDRVVELRRVAGDELPQFDGFTVSGDTLVWAESVSKANGGVTTTLWRANWRTGARATLITANTGEASFSGREYDIVVESGRVSWVSVGAGEQTEVRSVLLGGGQVGIQRLQGQYVLSAYPWVVSLAGGRGTPVELVNLNTNERMKVATAAAEVATCGPVWCRMAIVNDVALVRLELQRPDGSQRRRIAGAEATPTITDATVLDRFVPLKTDGRDGAAGVDLSVYDIASQHAELIASGVSDIQTHAGMLWWSTGAGDDLVWHAIDLRAVT